ncbi:hypothetical protein JCGZ_11972 [Jatropha curcas]|uniref:Uncharacterized protein n=1 Tax=Jatropha curcas TaxID=180498 RepID=A0A067KQM8_JATCU|nr:hypothetical protein JCGZ_11972 [Jatropha curcas]
MTKEIPAVPRLGIDLASPILLVFRFSAYGIPTYELGADVVPLQQLVEHALEMDHASTYWAPLVCFYILIYRASHDFYIHALRDPMRLTIVVAYYASRMARQYGRHQAVRDYARFEGGLIT